METDKKWKAMRQNQPPPSPHLSPKNNNPNYSKWWVYPCPSLTWCRVGLGVGSRHTMVVHVWLPLRRLETGEESKTWGGWELVESSEIRISSLSLSLSCSPTASGALSSPPSLSLSPPPPPQPSWIHTHTHTHKPLAFLHGCISVCLSSPSALPSAHPVRYAHKPGCSSSLPLLQTSPPPPPPPPLLLLSYISGHVPLSVIFLTISLFISV